MAQTVLHPTGADVFNYQEELQRAIYLRGLGATNADPPLPASPCLKNIKTGIVLPWNSSLAEQRDLMLCCDEYGNTDPAAWMPKVKEPMSEHDMRVAVARSQQQVLEQATHLMTGYNTQTAQPQVQNAVMPFQAVPFTEIESLMSMGDPAAQIVPPVSPMDAMMNLGE